jgi:hypothetical protein
MVLLQPEIASSNVTEVNHEVVHQPLRAKRGLRVRIFGRPRRRSTDAGGPKEERAGVVAIYFEIKSPTKHIRSIAESSFIWGAE